MRDALKGITILEVGTMTPGKFAGFLLAGWGASSIRIERTNTAGPISDEDLTLNRGKRSIALNLREPDGLDVLMRLAAKADVFMESYRPGVAARLGIGVETVRKVNPKLVYCSLSGYGQTGPDAERPAYDLNIQAETGFSHLIAGGHDPVPSGTYIADSVSGLMIAFALTAALRRRDASGEGSHLELSMQDNLFSLLAVSHGTMRGTVSPQTLPSRAAYDIFETADGRHLALGAARSASCTALFEHLGRPDLAAAGMLRGADGEPARAFLRDTFRHKPAAAWVEELIALDIEIAPVNTPREAFGNRQLAERSMIINTTHPTAGPLRQIGIAGIGADVGDMSPAPATGDDTDAILHELGYDETGIAALHSSQVV